VILAGIDSLPAGLRAALLISQQFPLMTCES